MSLVTTLVSLSQALRNLANRMQTKAIKAIEGRISKLEGEQRDCELERSFKMIELHNEHYSNRAGLQQEYCEALANLESEFTQRINKVDSDFAEDKGSIAIKHQGISDNLKRELAMLGRELDHLTK
jgi:hypothetical protein